MQTHCERTDSGWHVFRRPGYGEACNDPRGVKIAGPFGSRQQAREAARKLKITPAVDSAAQPAQAVSQRSQEDPPALH
jgi:hypothetical protein